MPTPRIGGPLVAALLLSCGCAGKDAVKEPVKLRSMTFAIAQDSNGARPARVELVRVRDDALIADLVAIDTAAWFGADGEAFRAAHPDAVYDSWELVPGEAPEPFDLRADGDFAGVLFCNTDAGTPPLRVRRNGRLTVEIDDGGCVLTGGKRKEKLTDRLRRRTSAKLSLAVQAQVNRSRPVRVELVRVSNPVLVADLTRIDSRAWFGAAGRKFRQAHPEALYDDWELVPGYTYGPFGMAVNRRVPGVLFCSVSGAKAVLLEWRRGRRGVEVEIGDRGCKIGGR